MRITRRRKKLDLGLSFRGMGFVFLCIITLLMFMEFVVVGIRFLFGYAGGLGW